MKKAKKPLLFVLFLLMGILIGVFCFNYFEIRPKTIRKNCMIQAIDESLRIYTQDYEPVTAKRAELQEKFQAVMYKNCLNIKGLAN